jgi:hypothetical protein
VKSLFFIFIFFAHGCFAQWIVRPLIGQNTFQIDYAKGQYSYGGKLGASSFMPALDVEYRFGKKLDSMSSLMQLATNPRYGIITGIGFWRHLNSEKGISLSSDDISSSYRSSFVCAPLIFKYYMQMGVLNENMKIGFGLGAIGLYRLNTELHEEAVIYARDQNFRVISEQLVEDTRDITQASAPLAIGFCIEMSFEYERFYVAFRAWGAGQDQYAKGIKGDWKVPYDHSIYLQAYDRYQSMTLTGISYLIGFRITSLKP